MSDLRIALDDDVRTVQPDATLTFGRRADLVVAENPDVADIAGRLRHAGGFWWLTNHSLSHRLELVDRASPSMVTVPSGVEVVVAFASSFIDVFVDPARYRLSLEVELPLVESSGTLTADQRGDVTLNADQRVLLTMLGERQLRTGVFESLPSNSDVAKRLGWSPSKLHRKLDHLAIKFSKLGIEGLRGDREHMANDRRLLLVRHVVQTGLITAADLSLLENDEAAKSENLSDD